MTPSRAAILAVLVSLVWTALAAPSTAEDPRRADNADAIDPEWRVTREHWYVLRLAGVDCGWMRVAVRERGELLRTESEMSLRIDRGGEPVEITTLVEFDETRRGDAVRLRTVQRMGQNPVETVFRFDHPELAVRGRVHRTVRQGGVETSGDEPRPAGDWLPPAAAERFSEKRRDAGAAEIVYDTIDGQSGLQVSTIRSRRDGELRVEIGDRSVPVTRWRIVSSAAPVETIALVGRDGVLVESRVDLGFGELHSRLATEEEVRELRPGRLPDLIVSTMVRPDRPVDDVMRSRRAQYRLSLPEGSDLPDLPDLPTAGAQRFERLDRHRAIVHVDRAEPAPASEAEIADESYRTASATIDIDDEVIRSLHARATRGMAARTPAERAEACRAFVARHVRNKGLDVAFATASEVARRGEGDCSEHAVLLCALLRVDGIASRIASGLIFVPEFAGQRNVFGWHMWTQALLEVEVDGETAWRWIDLDATLPVPSHAGAILTGVSSMAHGPTDPAMTAMLPLLGRLSIEVIDVGHERGPAGRPRGTGRSARPRRRAGGRQHRDFRGFRGISGDLVCTGRAG